jgi:opacity protein-like surface antigen
MNKTHLLSATLLSALAYLPTAQAGENLLGYTKGAEPLPKGALEFYQIFTHRSDKGQGTYTAIDSTTELEYGFSNRFSGSAAIIGHSVETKGLIIGGYLPQEKSLGLTLSGIEAQLKYSFLTPALNDIGLSASFGIEYDTIDQHSGQDKDTLSANLGLQLQKYFMDGQLVWLGNADLETTHATRDPIKGINDEAVWPTKPEMEIGVGLSTGLSYRFAPNWSVGAETIYETEYETEVGQERWSLSTGLSYRFAPNWSVGAETIYETEYETEVGQERWSLFAGPSIHYGNKHFWSTLTVLGQLSGGGETYDNQSDTNLHLIEKTKQEVKFKLGYNF